jgi:hypothetical protein
VVKSGKTAAELEASIKVEMEDICDYSTDMVISVQPDASQSVHARRERGVLCRSKSFQPKTSLV